MKLIHTHEILRHDVRTVVQDYKKIIIAPPINSEVFRYMIVTLHWITINISTQGALRHFLKPKLLNNWNDRRDSLKKFFLKNNWCWSSYGILTTNLHLTESWSINKRNNFCLGSRQKAMNKDSIFIFETWYMSFLEIGTILLVSLVYLCDFLNAPVHAGWIVFRFRKQEHRKSYTFSL